MFGLVIALVLSAPFTAAAEDYSLPDLYRLALERSDKLKLSEENLTIARLGKDKAMSVLIPRVTAFGNYVRYSEDKYNALNMLVQPQSAEQWGLRMDQQFSFSLREFTALSFSKENISKNDLDLAANREEYLFQVAQSYYDVLKARKGLEIAQANLERLAKYRDAADKRLKVGEITKTVLLRAEAQLSAANSDKVRVENGLALTKVILARLVGLESDFNLKEQPQPDVPTMPVDKLKALAASERSDLKSSASAQKMAALQVSFARGAFWPNLALSGVYQRADQNPEGATLIKDSRYGALGLSFPFFEGGLRQAELAEAKSRERQARYAYADLKKDIEMQVEAAYLDLMTQKGTITYLSDQLKFARDNYFAVSRQFEVGLASSLDVLDANNLLVSSERQLADATYTYQLATLMIKRTTGTLLKEIAGNKS